MYESLKRIAKLILPASILSQNENYLRRLIAKKYKGDRYQCNVCLAKLNDWVLLDRGDRLCPSCGSLPRSRRLWKILSEENLEGKDILHFSPPKHLRQSISNIPNINYITTDFESEFESDESYDITNIPEYDERFDFIICYHVLEHIVDDEKAISELTRVLKKGGKLYVQTPFHDMPTDENSDYNTPELRLKHYGQKDHVRIYNAEELLNKFEVQNLDTLLLSFKTDDSNYHGLKKKETILLIQK